MNIAIAQNILYLIGTSCFMVAAILGLAVQLGYLRQ